MVGDLVGPTGSAPREAGVATFVKEEGIRAALTIGAGSDGTGDNAEGIGCLVGSADCSGRAVAGEPAPNFNVIFKPAIQDGDGL